MRRILELYCGIGGVSAALGDTGQVVGAFDINTRALEVYRLNFPHPTRARNLESVAGEELGKLDAELWWLSAPCQPFTRRGRRRDADDPRAWTFLHMIRRIGEVRPPWVAVENVPGFVGSRVHDTLLEALARAGYTVAEQHLCPSDLGLPNRRRRYYLVASRRGEPPLPPPPADPLPRRPLADFLDPRPEPGLDVDPDFAQRYARALDVVDADDRQAVTSCFTSGYGRSRVRSGSYLRYRQPDGEPRLRRFSPREILRLLGFPESYRLPPSLDRNLGWRLAGNSVSLPPVRRVLARVPGLEPLAQVDG